MSQGTGPHPIENARINSTMRQARGNQPNLDIRASRSSGAADSFK